jgi:hypothetical protein
MSYEVRNRDQHLANDGRPKRILALDGGGLRGILSLAILQKVEDLLRQRHRAGADFRLSDYFDLIAGTSTGAIIAAALALGWSVEEIRKTYMDLGKQVFKKSYVKLGIFRAKYDDDQLIAQLKKVFGPQTVLGGPELKTGLLVMTKRIDTGSPWPIGNNPQGKYFSTRAKGVVGNSEYPLWQVVRASTAAPAYFDPERIIIARTPGAKAATGEFIDGGVSPFNNPSLMALMYATMNGFRLSWPTGADNLLLISIGTGAADPEVTHASLAAKQAINALLSLMNDTAALQETLLQWLSHTQTPRIFDREMGNLQAEVMGGVPMLTYLRYNVDLRADEVRLLDPDLRDGKVIESLSAMDAPENMATLHRLGALAADRDVKETHFPENFDLRQMS